MSGASMPALAIRCAATSRRSSGSTRDGDAPPPVDDAARPRRRRWRTPARAASPPRARRRWPSISPPRIALATYSFIAALGFGRVFGDWEFVGDVTDHRRRRPRLVARAAVAAHPGRCRRRGDAAGARVDGRLPPLRVDLHRPVPDDRDVGRGLGRPVAWCASSSASPSRRSSTSVGGRCWPRSAPRSSCSPATRSRSGPTPAARRWCQARCCSWWSPRSAPTSAGSRFALALVASGFLAAVLLRARAAPPPRTILGRARHPLSTVLPAALAAGGLVVLAAWIIGPRLPGANDEPLVDTRNERGGVTEVISPLVDIRSRLVNRSATELFVVNATVPAYWRVTALPEFDGRTWAPARPLPRRRRRRPAGGAAGIDGEPPGDRHPRPDGSARAGRRRAGRRVRPAAALERRDVDAGQGRRGAGHRRPLRHRVGDAGVHARQELQAATSRQPPDPIYLELPDDFPSSVAEQASVLTAGAPTAYDAAMRAAELVPLGVRVQHRRAPRPRQLGHRGLPAPAHRLLRAVRRDVRRHDALARHPVPRRRRLHAGPGAAGRIILGARAQRPRLAGGVVRPVRLGRLRADAGPRRTRRRVVHRCRAGAGRDGPGARRGRRRCGCRRSSRRRSRRPRSQPSDLVPDEAAPAAPPSFSPISVRVEGPQLAYVAILDLRRAARRWPR